MNTKSLFLAKLTNMFGKVEPDFRHAVKCLYRSRVARQFEEWQETLKLPFDQLPLEYGHRHIPRSPEYVSFEGALSHTWEAYQKATWIPLTAKAERDAEDEVRNAKDHFTTKLADKLAKATGLRTDRPKLTGTLVYGVRITGWVKASYPNGDSFQVELSIVRNCRYERGYRPYWQFPVRFAHATINGVTVKPKSLAWMQLNFRASP